MTALDKKDITKKTPEKSLLAVNKKNAGRNNQGKITVRHQGGGTRRQYRIIDFKRNKDGIPAVVAGIEYDPNRTANIALLNYADGEKAYIIAPNGLTDGMTVMSGPTAEIKVGNLREQLYDKEYSGRSVKGTEKYTEARDNELKKAARVFGDNIAGMREAMQNSKTLADAGGSNL